MTLYPFHRILSKNDAIEEEFKGKNGPNLMVTAVLFESKEILKILIDKAPTLINMPMPDTGWTPLMLAAKLGHLSLTKILLENDADPNAVNALGLNVNDVAQDNIKNVLKGLIEIKPSDEINSPQNCFFEACKDGEYEVVKNLHEKHPNDLDINEVEKGSGATGLMLVAIIGHLELVQWLITQGANLNPKDFVYGWTPLMQATFYGHEEVTRVLLKFGADPTITAYNGCTALDLATLMEDSNTTVIRMLAEETVNIGKYFTKM